MLALGYTSYVAQGGDLGSLMVHSLALYHSEHCKGIHLNFVVVVPNIVSIHMAHLAMYALEVPGAPGARGMDILIDSIKGGGIAY